MSTKQIAVAGTATRRRRSFLPGLAAVAAYGALIYVAHAMGRSLSASGGRLGLGAPPLIGRFDPRLSFRVVLPLALAVGVVIVGHRVALTIPWRRLSVVSFALAGAWAVALALMDGAGALTAPLANPLDSFAYLPHIHGLGGFLNGFVGGIDRLPIHVQGHPPGLLVLLYALRAIGLASPGWVTAMYIAAGASAVPAALVAARAVAGEQFARAAAPWLVLAPFALWVATSADALYAGVAAWAIALMLADRTAGWLAGGVLLGCALFLSYGVTLLAILPTLVWLSRRRVRPLVVAAAGILAVAGAFALAGFWWFDGLAATRERYHDGLGGLRPSGFFVLANLAALAIAVGPAAVRGLAAVVERGAPRMAWHLVGGALLAVLLANLSGLSKGEVERIWLPFMPWLVLAAGWIRGSHGRHWLSLSAASAILVQALVVTPW